MNHGKLTSVSQWALAGLFAVVAVSLAAGGYWFYGHETRVIQSEKYNELKAIAQLKVNQIVAWRQERLADARMNLSGLNRTYVLRWLAASGDASLKADVSTQLQMFRDNQGYQNMILAATDGRILLSLDPRLADLDSNARQLIAQAVSSRSVVFGDFFRCPVCNQVHLDVAAPILDADNHPAAALILRTDPENYLYPLIQSWPTPSRTAETLLIRRDGDDVLFLDQLRHRPDPALTLRIPLSRADVPAAQAALGKTGEFKGRDYRGVEVLADIRPVPGSPWFMVAKVDTNEILAEVHYRGRVILLLVALAILMTGFAAAFVGSYRRKDLYKSLFRAERERREAQEEIRATLYGIGDAVIATDAARRVTRMNLVAGQLTGWTEAEALGKPLEQVFHIVNEESRAEVENPVARVLREGVVAGLANHSLLIARDGTERAIADSGAPIRNEQGQITGVVLVFRDQTEERRQQSALRESEERFRAIIENAPFGYYRVGKDGLWQYVNPVWERMHGLSQEEVVGKSFEITQPEGYVEQARKLVARALAGESIAGEFGRLTKEGSTEYHSFNIQPVKRGKEILAVEGFINDITERRRAEEALRGSRKQLRALAIRFAELEETERRRLAQELHDQVGQTLAVLGIDLHLVREELPPDSARRIGARLDDAFRLIEQTAESVRGVMSDLRPAVLDDYGLLAALQSYGEQSGRRTGVAVEILGQELAPRLSPEAETAAFRIAQEALTNAAKHARARRVTVTLEETDAGARLTIADDGVGFDTSTLREPAGQAGWGLLIMRERAAAVGGEVRVESEPGKGTRVIVEIGR